MLRMNFFVLFFLSVSLVPCLQRAEAANYQLSMLPRYSTEEIYNRITPLAEYLKKETGLDVSPTLTSTFDQYTKQLQSGRISIGFENPYIYVLASKNHEAIAMAVKGTDGDKFRGIIITKNDSPIRSLSDLKGKRISIVGYSSAGGYLSQRLTLLGANIDVRNDCQVEEAPENKQENVVFSVFTGDADAGFIRESALARMEQYVPMGVIRVLARTAWLPNWALSVRRSMTNEDKDKIIKAIRALPKDSPVLKALHIKAFRPASDSDYDPVRRAAGIASSPASD
jgi:phosphonate transport system substrate-binding protein